MLQSRMRALLLFVCAANWTPEPTFTQDVATSTPRELRISGTDGQPSLSVRIWTEGQKGVVAVRDEKGTELQKLVCPLLRDTDEATKDELAAVHEQFVEHFVIADLDFDGYADLAGIREFGAKWARYCVWLYDPKQHVYVKDFLAEQMELLTNLKPLGDSEVSSSHMEPANSWIAVYRVAGADGSWPVRQLVPIRSCLVESTSKGKKPTALVIAQFEGGKIVVHRQDAARIDMRSALDKCSFSVLKATTAQVLSLNRTNTGERVTAEVGQLIIVTLQTIGGGQYGKPKVSSSSVRFESSSFPATQNPGGPTQVYRFTATEEGEAKLEIPHSGSNPTFKLTIQVAAH
jgi:hypothetical protein